MEKKIQEFLKKQKRFPDSFTVDITTDLSMTHYDEKGLVIEYDTIEGDRYGVHTPDGRYGDDGKLNMRCFDTLTVDLI